MGVGWGGGGEGGVLSLIFNYLFTALVLIEIVSNFQSLFPNPSHSIAMNTLYVLMGVGVGGGGVYYPNPSHSIAMNFKKALVVGLSKRLEITF